MKPSSENWATALQKSIARWEVVLPPDGLEYFQVYLEELDRWNSQMNLTALKEPQHVALGHFADSIAALSVDEVFKAEHVRAIDIGSGAGFPGLPLKIVNPTWSLSLVESIGKKTDFLKAVVGAMEMNHVEVLNKRCEELGWEKEHREKYDFVFARALSNLSTLIEYAMPFLKVGGSLVAHRGRTAADEVGRVNVAMDELGAEAKGVHYYEIAGMPGARALVVIRKVKPTSKRFPRRIGVAAKNPL